LAQPGGIAMNVGNDSQFHLTISVVARPPRMRLFSQNSRNAFANRRVH
jgi:hypothetical protein